MHSPSFAWFVLSVSPGCFIISGEDIARHNRKSDPSPSKNTDADADTDTDADADVDTDADADLPLSGRVDQWFVGYTVLEPVFDGPYTLCDSSYTLTGTDYTGACPGCDFVFEITSTPDAALPETCSPNIWRTLDGSSFGYRTLLGFAPDYNGLTNALLVNYIAESYGYTQPFGGWYVVRADGLHPDEQFSFDGEQLHWELDQGGIYPIGYGPYLYSAAYCPLLTYPTYASLVVGDVSASGTVECSPGAHGDIFEVSLSAGLPIAFSANTTDPYASFDPRITVIDPYGCIVASGDENVDCSFPPPTGYRCPAGSFSPSYDGIYRFQISAYPYAPSCTNGSYGSYDLQIASLVPGFPVSWIVQTQDELLLYNEVRDITSSYSLTLDLNE